jgi:hypothetical protein
MIRTIASVWALLALLATAGGAAAAPPKAEGKKTIPVCCANHPASHAKCCKSGSNEACCHSPKRADKEGVRVCAVTGKPLQQCCGSKASQMPPCCQKACKSSGKTGH